MELPPYYYLYIHLDGDVGILNFEPTKVRGSEVEGHDRGATQMGGNDGGAIKMEGAKAGDTDFSGFDVGGNELGDNEAGGTEFGSCDVGGSEIGGSEAKGTKGQGQGKGQWQGQWQGHQQGLWHVRSRGRGNDTTTQNPTSTTEVVQGQRAATNKSKKGKEKVQNASQSKSYKLRSQRSTPNMGLGIVDEMNDSDSSDSDYDGVSFTDDEEDEFELDDDFIIPEPPVRASALSDHVGEGVNVGDSSIATEEIDDLNNGLSSIDSEADEREKDDSDDDPFRGTLREGGTMERNLKVRGSLNGQSRVALKDSLKGKLSLQFPTPSLHK
ncbi:hypothetical protein JCGZ_13569 [Jatropha curcas]|uniref:Uncharacterized protein n=1 Tax=Jatropha curcas TaxID=180498 RepID=A0A067KAE6_JATCU|nr:hypothetical protein JCGZ_13569 [Jatropha curcas]